MSDWEAIYDMILDYEIATADELGMAMHFNGANMETMQEVLYYKTGYRSFEQMKEEEGDE